MRKFEFLRRLVPREIEKLYRGNLVKTQIKPYLCKGVLFTIMVGYEVDGRPSEITAGQGGTGHEGRPLLQIIRHDADGESEVCREQFLINKNEFFCCNKDHFPGVIHRHKLYYSVIHLDDWACGYKVLAFDFNNPEAEPEEVASKKSEYPKAENGKTSLLPFMSSISQYIAPAGTEVGEDEFRQSTIVMYYFKSKDPVANNCYEFKQEHFSLQNFEKKLDSRGRRLNITNQEIQAWSELPPLLSFVENSKYYTCEYRKKADNVALIPGAAFGITAETTKKDKP